MTQKNILQRLFAFVVGCSLGIFFQFAQPAAAATVVVTNDGDIGPGSLRQALADISAGDTISFGGDFTIHLASTLAITKDVTIDGAGHSVTLSGDTDNNGMGDVRVLSVAAGATLNLQNLTVTGGSSGTCSDGSCNGGGLYNSGTVNLTNCTFAGNKAYNGAGIYNNSGSVNIVNSTFSGNYSGRIGGGIDSEGGTVNLTNCTFAGNEAVGGGGMTIMGGTASVKNSTFSGNYAHSWGKSIWYGYGTLHLANTILGNGTSFLGAATECENYYESTLGTNTNNLVQDGSCAAALSGNPVLGPLADNGGPTWTLKLLPDSPAIDAGDPATCAAAGVNSLDQRGKPRNDLRCDIGALELNPDDGTLVRKSDLAQGTPYSFGPTLARISRDTADDPGLLTVTGTSWGTQPPLAVTRFWDIGAGNGAYSLTLSLCVTDQERNGLTAGDLHLWRYDGSTWEDKGGTLDTGNPGFTCTAASGITALGRWTLATGDPRTGGPTLTVTADNQSKAFGSVDPVFTFRYSGFVNGDTAAALSTQPTCTVGVPHQNAGAYPITCSGGADEIYLFNYLQGTLTVNPIGTTTTLTASGPVTTPRDRVTFTATVTSTVGVPTGTVSFRDNGNSIGCDAQALNGSGTATCVLDSLPAGSHAITAVYGGDTNHTGSSSLTWTAAVWNVDLAALTLSTGTLNPSFAPGTTMYTARMTTDVASITVTPTASDPAATVTLNGVIVPSGSASGAIPLALGDNTMTVIVTAPDGVTARTYTVVVTRLVVVVTNGGDSGAGSLRQALAIAPAGGIAVFTGDFTIHLASTLAITKDVTIDGAGHSITLSGDTDNNGTGDVQVLSVNGGVSLELRNLTVTKGYCSGQFCVGAGLHNAGNTTLVNCTFAGNYADNVGGGIGNEGTLSAVNSTFADNTAMNAGGGIASFGTATLTNCTFGGNYAYYFGKSILVEGSTLNFSNTVMGNGTGSGSECYINDGYLGTNTNNLVQDGSCSPSLSGNPGLGPLADNGGHTRTVALLPDSPAIDAGDAATCAAAGVNSLDQRGKARNDLRCDIGAFELTYDDGDVTRKSGLSQGTTYSFGPTLTGIRRDTADDPGTVTVTKVRMWGAQPATAVTRFWDIGTENGVYSLTLSLCVTDQERNGLNAGDLHLWRYNGSAWEDKGGTLDTGHVGLACTGASGVTALGRWTLATGDPGTAPVGPTLTVTADDKGKAYGAVDPAFTLRYGGFVNGDTSATLTTPPVCTVSAPHGNAGTYPITCSGGVDEMYLFSYVNGTLTVTPVGTSTTLSTSETPSFPGIMVTFTATVTSTAGIPGGTVAFLDNGASIGCDAQPLNGSGTATCPVANLAPGTHAITAAYGGDTNHTGSSSLPLSQVVKNLALSALFLSSGTLTPPLTRAMTTYTATVPPGVSSITVTPAASDPTATITVNGVAVAPGSASGAIPLITGANTITIVVTAQDGVTSKAYTVIVTRVSNNADLASLTLSSGTLTPAFAPDTTSYTATVAAGVTRVTAAVADWTATLTVDGVPVASGSASGAIPVKADNDTITVVVTAQDGTTKTYTVAFRRLAVTNDGDSGQGSLRQVLAEVPAGGVITFAGDFTIHLASTLTIARDVTIDGAGHTVTLSGDTDSNGTGDVQVLSVAAGTTLNLRNLTVADGTCGSDSCHGGGVYNAGTVNLSYCTFVGNSAGFGGALFNEGTLNARNCTFADNSASGGGALASMNGTVNITNCTFSGNHGAMGGKSIYVFYTLFNLVNTIVANGSGSSTECDLSRSALFQKNNLVEDGSCSASLSGNPLLGPLAYNGGPTRTMALLPRSPAIDAADDDSCPATDQRGIARPQGDHCDIGAYESRGFTLAKTGGDSQHTGIGTGFPTPLEVTVAETAGSPLPGALVTFSAPGSGAGATFAGSPATTGPDGKATVTAQANGAIGSYLITAAIAGDTFVTFYLTNTPVMFYTLTVTLPGTGSGTVTSAPAGISCHTGSTDGCGAPFTGTVLLTASPSVSTSTFDGWGGACSGQQGVECTVTVDGPKTASATFTLAPWVKLDGVAKDTLQHAYDQASDNSVIQLLDNVVLGTLNANRHVFVRIRGGWNADGSANPGVTTITAPLVVVDGSVEADMVSVR